MDVMYVLIIVAKQNWLEKSKLSLQNLKLYPQNAKCFMNNLFNASEISKRWRIVYFRK